MSELNPIELYRLLTRETHFQFPLEGSILQDTQVSEVDLQKIMTDLGRHISYLHQVEGEGYGEIDAESLLKKGKLVGLHKSWHQFLLENFQERLKSMDKVSKEEEKAGREKTELSSANRELMDELIKRRKAVLSIIDDNKNLLEGAPSRFLNGNLYLGNIIVKDGKFVGLGDFHQPLLGDPVDDIAYFSIMPKCEEFLPFVLKGWNEQMSDKEFDKKIHLYRLLESYRKVIKRYIKYQWLQDYPEPLIIARQELVHYNKW